MNFVENRSLELNERIFKIAAFACVFCCKHSKECFGVNSSECKVLGKTDVCPCN